MSDDRQFLLHPVTVRNAGRRMEAASSPHTAGSVTPAPGPIRSAHSSTREGLTLSLICCEEAGPPRREKTCQEGTELGTSARSSWPSQAASEERGGLQGLLGRTAHLEGRAYQEMTGKSGSYGMWNHPRGHVWNVFVRPASS